MTDENQSDRRTPRDTTPRDTTPRDTTNEVNAKAARARQLRDDHLDDEVYDPNAAPDAAPDNVDASAALAERQDAQRKQFEVEQQARADAFERDQQAAATKFARDQEAAQAKARASAAILAANQENDERAFADGLLTHDDLIQRNHMLSQHHGCLFPHEALAADEPTVKMGFPRTVTLTRSANDIRRTDPLWASGNFDGNYPNAITHGSRVVFLKGYQNVPESLADHQYLYDNGAWRVGDDGKPETAEARAERIQAKQDEAWQEQERAQERARA